MEIQGKRIIKIINDGPWQSIMLRNGSILHSSSVEANLLVLLLTEIKGLRQEIKGLRQERQEIKTKGV